MFRQIGILIDDLPQARAQTESILPMGGDMPCITAAMEERLLAQQARGDPGQEVLVMRGMDSLPWRRAAGIAMALALAGLFVGAAIQPVGAERAYDRAQRNCEAQGGHVVGNDPQGAHTYWCFLPDGGLLSCVFNPGSIITNLCVDLTPPKPAPGGPPRPGDPGIAPPLTRPPDDGTFEAVDLDPKPAMQVADEPAPETSADPTSTGSTMQMASIAPPPSTLTARQMVMTDEREP